MSLLSWVGLARAEAPAPAEWAIQMQGEPSLFHVGDDPAWASPSFDDSDWQPAVMGRPWRLWSSASVDDARGWYRVRLKVRPDYPLGLANRHIHAAAEVYVDGQLLHTFGELDGGAFELFTPVFFEVPREYTSDGEIVVATRVANQALPLGSGFMQPWGYGHPEGVVHRPAQERRQRSSFTLVWTLVGPGLVGLGCLHGLLWVRRREPAQGFFALGATMLGLWLLQSGLTSLGEMAPHEIWISTYVPRQTLSYVAFLWFGFFFVGAKSYRALWAVTALLIVGTLLRTVLPLSFGYLLFKTSYAVAAVTCIALIVAGIRRRTPYARLLAAGFLPATGFAVVETVVVMASRWGIETFSFDTTRSSIILFGFVCILVTMSVALTSRFADTLDELERTWRATARFVPDQFLALLGRRRITEVERGDSTSRDMTVMFCSIPGFSDTTEGWTAEQSFAFLNRFLGAMEPCIHDNGGFVAQYLGDGFLAMFPVGSSRPVDAAVALQEAARALEPEPGQGTVKVTIGLHTGRVMLGTVGSEERLTTGQVSDVVNTSARVRGLTAHYGAPIVISEATRALIEDEGWAVNELDAVVMKGKVEAVRAYEVLSGEPDLVLRRYKESEAGAYGAGLAAFRAGDLATARPLFARLADRWEAARLFVRRCDWFLTHGLPDDWDGVVRMTVK